MSEPTTTEDGACPEPEGGPPAPSSSCSSSPCTSPGAAASSPVAASGGALRSCQGRSWRNARRAEATTIEADVRAAKEAAPMV